MAILLDFAKAYDPLDKHFLYEVSSRHGYPKHLVQVIEKLRTGTSVRFFANGMGSQRVQVTKRHPPGLSTGPASFHFGSVTLVSTAGKGGHSPRHLLDDRAEQRGGLREELAAVLAVVEEFGVASGLCLNCGKTIVIALHRNGLSPGAVWIGPIQLLENDEWWRYLGVQAGSKSIMKQAWHLVGEQLQVRIRLACQITLTVNQRASVAAAVIIPKLLFIG